MYCPQCLVEYPLDLTQCVDCLVPLVEGQPPEQQIADPYLDSVPVFESSSLAYLTIAKNALEQAGVPYFEQINVDAGTSEDAESPCRILVPPDRAEEAVEILRSIPEFGT